MTKHVKEIKEYFIKEANSKDYQDIFTKRLKYFRKKRNIHQKDLSKYIHMSGRACAISNYENGNRYPNDETMLCLATKLDLNPLFLKWGIDFQLYEYAKEYVKIYETSKPKNSRV